MPIDRAMRWCAERGSHGKCLPSMTSDIKHRVCYLKSFLYFVIKGLILTYWLVCYMSDFQDACKSGNPYSGLNGGW